MNLKLEMLTSPEAPATADGTATSSAINLRRLVALRTISLLAQAAMAVIAVRWLDILLPLEPITGLLLAGALLNLLTWLSLRRSWPVRDTELFTHLVLDVLLLTALLYFSGGSTNPFAPLYLLPLTLTAAALSWRFTWPMLLLATACYSLLLFFYVPLEHRHQDIAAHVLDDFRVYVIGTWLGFLLSGCLIAFFAVRMRETVRERDRLRARMREQELRHERMLALGTFAAGAAHELGTPLATIAVLAKELLRTDERDAQRLRVLREQVDRCKAILGSLTAAVGETRAESASACELDQYLSQLIDRWRDVHPHLEPQVRLHGTSPPPRIVAELTLNQALLNVLNNAAEASSCVAIEAHWNDAALDLEISDRGSGFSPHVLEHVGEPFFTTKPPGSGMGLGLFLARSTLERCGGTLRLANRAEGGAVCRIHLPLTQLLITTVPRNDTP
jgi:two-component system sensor histidine kinase RegB